MNRISCYSLDDRNADKCNSSPTRAVHDLRNLCMRSSQYKDFLTAQFDVADAIDLIMEGRLDYKTGKRYINRISVVEADEDTYKFDVTDVFRYDHEAKELRPHKCVSDKFLTKLLDYGMPYENITMIKEMFARFEREGMLIGDEDDEMPKKKRTIKVAEEVEA